MWSQPEKVAPVKPGGPGAPGPVTERERRSGTLSGCFVLVLVFLTHTVVGIVCVATREAPARASRQGAPGRETDSFRGHLAPSTAALVPPAARFFRRFLSGLV